MKRTSAGLLMYRKTDFTLEVFLAHPGGPFFRKKDLGFWTIPKGEPTDKETLEEAAQREFEEETGVKPSGPFIPLTPVKQTSGKTIFSWAFEFREKTLPPLQSNDFSLEWPPKSGKILRFPEIDQVAFFQLTEAMRKILPTQKPLLEEFKKLLRN